jgi:alpha-beta hydrolase superfamily lysophospholipase
MFGDVECDFVKDYKHLHDAGYDVIADDLRNHGRSADSITRSEDVQKIYDDLEARQGAPPD